MINDNKNNPAETQFLGPAIEIKFIHSSGPGGQNVNKVATCVQLRFNLSASNLSPEQLSRLKTLAPGQISQNNILIINARNHRSQVLNKKEALNRLLTLIANAKMKPPRPRLATRPTKRAVENRLAAKKMKSRNKNIRKKVIDSG
ncbi:MAG: alternative ribosome rescue aminoacyl-tRNA hydrolase ArfB [Candidatus Adiutrix sp.]